MKIQVTKNQSLLTTAFEVLLNNLGPQKTSQLWHLLAPSKTEYTKIRHKLFKGKVLNLYIKRLRSLTKNKNLSLRAFDPI